MPPRCPWLLNFDLLLIQIIHLGHSVFCVYNNVCMCGGYSGIHFMKKKMYFQKKSKNKIYMFKSPQINYRQRDGKIKANSVSVI